MNNRSHHLSPGRWGGGEVGGNLGGGNYMVLRENKGGISRGQQSINGLKKIDCQLIANKECYGSFTEPYGE